MKGAFLTSSSHTSLLSLLPLTPHGFPLPRFASIYLPFLASPNLPGPHWISLPKCHKVPQRHKNLNKLESSPNAHLAPWLFSLLNLSQQSSWQALPLPHFLTGQKHTSSCPLHCLYLGPYPCFLDYKGRFLSGTCPVLLSFHLPSLLWKKIFTEKCNSAYILFRISIPSPMG